MKPFSLGDSLSGQRGTECSLSVSEIMTILIMFPLTLFAQIRSGKQTDIYYIDSSCLPVCHLVRKKRHKVFNNVAEFGRTTMGWFFGLKLHVVINGRGELMAFRITRGNCHDSKLALPLLKLFRGLAFGDKGYISKKVFEQLMNSGLKLMTRKRKNMKNNRILSTLFLLLQKFSLESIIRNFHCMFGKRAVVRKVT